MQNIRIEPVSKEIEVIFNFFTKLLDTLRSLYYLY